MDYIQAGITSLQSHIRESLDISEKRNIFASMISGLLVSSFAMPPQINFDLTFD